jgi:hypothetical protein
MRPWHALLFEIPIPRGTILSYPLACFYYATLARSFIRPWHDIIMQLWHDIIIAYWHTFIMQLWHAIPF